MLIAKPLVLLFLLQQAGAKPPRTTFEKLQAGAHRPGVRVEVAAVVLPTSAIQVQSGATIRYFALAVPANGTFFKDAARALEEVKAAAAEAIKQLEAAVDDDASFKTKLDEVDKLESSASSPPRPRRRWPWSCHDPRCE